MAALETYIRTVLTDNPSFPSKLAEGRIFGSGWKAPRLRKSVTNRILLYVGSFNPPHRGHLHLLRRVFSHGCHDLNVIGAIILPADDDSVQHKIARAGGTFMFGKDERCMLWRSDDNFPEWAWMMQDDNVEVPDLLEQLQDISMKDGYKIAFVMLYGPCIASPSSPPDGAYGCEMVIMSDVARSVYYRRACDRIRDFKKCTRWGLIDVDDGDVHDFARAQVVREMEDRGEICLLEDKDTSKDDSIHAEEEIQARTIEIRDDLKHVLLCGRIDAPLAIRFIKCPLPPAPEVEKVRNTSSTIIRIAMRLADEDAVRPTLEAKALSPDVLWKYKSSWRDKAMKGEGGCVTFPAEPENIHSEVPENQIPIDRAVSRALLPPVGVLRAQAELVAAHCINCTRALEKVP